MPAYPTNIIDKEQLEAYMRMKPSLSDTAAWFKCAERTIERYIREHYNLTFVEFREQNMVHSRHALVREAMKQALGGNTAMLIFCLKNMCGWSDKLDVGTGSIQQFSLRYALGPRNNDASKEVIDVASKKEVTK